MKFEIYETAEGHFRWRLLQGLGVIAHGPDAFDTRERAREVVDFIRRNMPDATIDEEPQL